MSTGIIYCAHCLVNNKKYIGQTRTNLSRRITQHKDHSKKLNFLFYRAINKHGWNNFIWGIVEECNLEILNEREIYWIEYFNSYEHGYNSSYGGNYNINPKIFKKFTLTDSNGNSFNIINLSNFCRENNLDYRNIYSVINGRIKSYKGWRLPETDLTGYDSASYKNSKEFILKSPDGNIIAGKNISNFCEKNNLNRNAISRLLSGKLKSHKGWTLP